MTKEQKFSIIIPAHNEEVAIKRLLDMFQKEMEENKFKCEIIVVCNGCSDETANIVKRFEFVGLIETDKASKTFALNLGDEAANYFPRIYLDADVIINLKSISCIVETIKKRDVSVVVPVVKNDTSHSSFIVKAFYYVWQRMPYFRDGMIGCGVYGLSLYARSKFNCWPEVISDDGFIRAMFSADEREICHEAKVKILTPLTVSSLINIKTRSRLGRYELYKKYPQMMIRERREKKYFRIIFTIIKNPTMITIVPFYLYINIIARYRAIIQMKTLKNYRWERDITTRLKDL